MLKSFKDEGIILGRIRYSEADRIISIFTKNHGKVSLIAKGIRKPKSRKRGHLEVFSKVSFSATRSNSLGIITEVETIENFPALRQDLNKVSVAYFFTEVIGKISQDMEKNTELYELLNRFLMGIIKESSLKKFRNNFTKKALILTGFWPEDKVLKDPDKELENVLERQIASIRVGKKILK